MRRISHCSIGIGSCRIARHFLNERHSCLGTAHLDLLIPSGYYACHRVLQLSVYIYSGRLDCKVTQHQICNSTILTLLLSHCSMLYKMSFFSKLRTGLRSTQQLRPEEERMAYNEHIECIRKTEFPMLKGSSMLSTYNSTQLIEDRLDVS
jgi:hypothetical protein